MFRLLYKEIVSSPKRFAGHSKWANIKHTKGAKDLERSKIFARLCQRMKVAIHDGGSPNPEANWQLAQVIEIAKKQSMPSASIQNCIKSTQNDKSAAKSASFEIKGPSGCFIIALTFTDNARRTRDTIIPILKKHQATLVDHVSKHLFDYKGEIIAIPPADLENIDDVTVDHAIECGAEDVVPAEGDDNAFKFICDSQQCNVVSKKLNELNYDVKTVDLNFIPRNRVTLSDEDLDIVSRLVDKLQAHPDVVTLYDNIA